MRKFVSSKKQADSFSSESWNYSKVSKFKSYRIKGFFQKIKSLNFSYRNKNLNLPTNMKLALMIFFLMASSLTVFSQGVKKIEIENQIQNKTYSYAYILIQGKLFSKKLRVNVDFGDSPEQIKAGKEYSEKLTDRKSFASILNYMVENQYELVQTLDYTDTYSGTGGTSGVVFIMRKSNSN